MIDMRVNTARVIPTLNDLSKNERAVLVRPLRDDKSEVWLFTEFIPSCMVDSDALWAKVVNLSTAYTTCVPRSEFLKWELVDAEVTLKNSSHVLDIIGRRKTR